MTIGTPEIDFLDMHLKEGKYVTQPHIGQALRDFPDEKSHQEADPIVPWYCQLHVRFPSESRQNVKSPQTHAQGESPTVDTEANYSNQVTQSQSIVTSNTADSLERHKNPPD
ncbi:polyprotein [Corchorus olitorius]|uniref:Polyprotein n=1 Tax=Corchorus olitorius TaxID=93759 RepID=A0A1R3IW69_9ROSI|nr:polyprotein [Corchorus olitorius]